MVITLTIPLYIFLIFYVIFIIIVGIFVAVNIYHIFLSASFHLPSFVVTAFVIGSQFLVLFITWQMLGGTDWSQTVVDLSIPLPRFGA